MILVFQFLEHLQNKTELNNSEENENQTEENIIIFYLYISYI